MRSLLTALISRLTVEIWRWFRFAVGIESVRKVVRSAIMSVSVTSKGQITIPKRVRQALGLKPGTQVEFDLEGRTARLKVAGKDSRTGIQSRIEDGPGILNYQGPRIALRQLNGAAALRKAAERARR
jgi:antitoxin PrlF